MAKCVYCGFNGDDEQVSGCSIDDDAHCGDCHNEIENKFGG